MIVISIITLMKSKTIFINPVILCCFMVYLTKKESGRIAKELSNTSNKEINKIVKKLKSLEKKRVYVSGKLEIRKLLRNAFDNKRKVKIRYYSFHSDEHTTRIIDIYRLYTNSIIAYCYLREEERTFVIARINSAAILDEKYSIPENWSPESIVFDK